MYLSGHQGKHIGNDEEGFFEIPKAKRARFGTFAPVPEVGGAQNFHIDPAIRQRYSWYSSAPCTHINDWISIMSRGRISRRSRRITAAKRSRLAYVSQEGRGV